MILWRLHIKPNLNPYWNRDWYGSTKRLFFLASDSNMLSQRPIPIPIPCNTYVKIRKKVHPLGTYSPTLGFSGLENRAGSEFQLPFVFCRRHLCDMNKMCDSMFWPRLVIGVLLLNSEHSLWTQTKEVSFCPLLPTSFNYNILWFTVQTLSKSSSFCLYFSVWKLQRLFLPMEYRAPFVRNKFGKHNILSILFIWLRKMMGFFKCFFFQWINHFKTLIPEIKRKRERKCCQQPCLS